VKKIRQAALAYCQTTYNMNTEMRFLAAEVHLRYGEPDGKIRIVPIEMS
jgi:hypothetical protein